MNRFARYKALQYLWMRAKTLLAYLNGPRYNEVRLRAQRWQQIQIAERQISDGIIRGTGDPDSAARPGRGAEQGAAQAQRWVQVHYAAEAHRESQRQWLEHQRRLRGGR